MTDDRVALTKQVKEANDIVEVVGGYVGLRPAGGTFKGICPFHDDHRPSFDVDPRRQRYRCWSCNKSGDVFSFVQEYERLSFPEAVEFLARRVGISLEKIGSSQQNSLRAGMFAAVKWAVEQYHRCLLDSPLAEAARHYLGERKLTGETVRRFAVGYAPADGTWLLQRAEEDGASIDVLEKVGLLGQRQSGTGHYDRFRDRVLFPICDPRGRAVGFGGRIMPASPYATRAPKYYNSPDSPLFSKSEQLYGLDQARQAADKVGYLAVVEGYTDVLMAQQMGIGQVVATMGTALNARHVQQLRRFTPRVILVFDADAGGSTGVDRALELFVGHDVDLRIATLPEGLDPCDLLLKDGAEAFQSALTNAADVLEFRLGQIWAAEAHTGVEGKRRAVDAVLGVIALAPEMTDHAGALKRELMITRIAQRLGLKEETVWARLKEIRTAKRSGSAETRVADPDAVEERKAPAATHERELLQLLLAEPALVPVAAAAVTTAQVEHPGLRQLLEGLYRLLAEGVEPCLELLRLRIDNLPLTSKALELQEFGRRNADRRAWLRGILERFRALRDLPEKQELQSQLHAASDHATALELLRQLQNRTGG